MTSPPDPRTPLPEWLTRLAGTTPEADAPDDRDFESDQAAVDAKLAPYRDRRYPERPDDPRVIDPARMARLRDRLLDRYAYRWRRVEAVDEIVDALFEPLIQSTGTRMALSVGSMFLDDEGKSPHPCAPADPRRFRKYHYITVSSLRLGAFLTSYEEAVRLLDNVLPDWGFCARMTPGGTTVRLERGGVQGEWFGDAGIATLIVAAMLDLLSRHPEAAKPWRGV